MSKVGRLWGLIYGTLDLLVFRTHSAQRLGYRGFRVGFIMDAAVGG